MYKLYIIGISEPFLSTGHKNILKKCVLLVATSRLADLAVDFAGDIQPVSPLPEAIETIRTALLRGNVAVLASGDPLFFGIGRRLLSEFSQRQVEIHPALSAVQRACALFKTPWDDAVIISLHGREHHHIPGMLLQNEKSLLFTDHKNSPTAIATKIISYLKLIGQTDLIKTIRISVAADIGLPGQKLFCGSLAEAAATDFSLLNIVLLQLPAKYGTPAREGNYPFALGLSEDDIYHSRGLITKNEIRAITLHRLQLPKRGVFWDIGGGSGSISIEAGRLNPDLTIYIIEHKGEEFQNILRNIRQFNCFNIIPVLGRAPDALKNLPQPDRVFVGGSSGSLEHIVNLVANRLTERGSLVINGVIEKTIQTAPEFMRNAGLTVNKSVIKVSREFQEDDQPYNYNPITVMSGTR